MLGMQKLPGIGRECAVRKLRAMQLANIGTWNSHQRNRMTRGLYKSKHTHINSFNYTVQSRILFRNKYPGIWLFDVAQE